MFAHEIVPSSPRISSAGLVRRVLYRRSKRVLRQALAARWRGPQRALEHAVRRFLAPLSRRDLSSLVGDRRVALAVAAALLATTTAAVALPPVELSDVAAGTGGFVVNGIDVLDNSGRSVSGAGDVNGDGLDDLIVGADGADPGGDSGAGESYVVFGKTGTAAVELSAVAAGTSGFVINGRDAADESGVSVSGAGDVNGDGLDDLIVGAYRADPHFDSYAGESYVVFGKAGTEAVELSDVASGTGGFVINGTESYDRSGSSVSGTGDVNGDGLDDLIVGAWGADPGGDSDAGESYVIFGKASTAAVELSDIAAGLGGFVVNGIDANDRSGRSVSGAGDVNGDGLDDLIVGAYRADPGGDSDAGESYVVFGKAGTAPVELSDVVAGTGGFVINGIDASDYSGVTVSGAGDVNGDRLDDLIVGAHGADPGRDSFAGESYVIFGKASTAPVELSDIAAGLGGFVINGIDVFDVSGRCVSAAGDVSGDGLDDLIVGAWHASPRGDSYAGESYVVFGKTGTAAVELSAVAAGTSGFVINGMDVHDHAGWSVSGAGDVNGDGLADVIVGAPAANPRGDNDAGESYVIFSTVGDCNSNGVSDEIDIDQGTSADCNEDSVPDECESDCDGDGVPDNCEVASSDCNDNGFSDLCDVLFGFSEDCDGNEVPDECEVGGLFINTSPDLGPIGVGSPQSYTLLDPPPSATDPVLTVEANADLGALTETLAIYMDGMLLATLFQNDGLDCPALPSAAAISIDRVLYNAAAGDGTVIFEAVASNAVNPDLCNPSYVAFTLEYSSSAEVDCNANGVPDVCDLILGASDDEDGNLVPDECDCPADFDGDGNAGFADLTAILLNWGPCPTPPSPCPWDVDRSGDVGFGDLTELLLQWGCSR